MSKETELLLQRIDNIIASKFSELDAKILKRQYTAFINEGFNPAQALRLILAGAGVINFGSLGENLAEILAFMEEYLNTDEIFAKTARAIRKYYEALIKEDFSEEQAMVLCILKSTGKNL